MLLNSCYNDSALGPGQSEVSLVNENLRGANPRGSRDPAPLRGVLDKILGTTILIIVDK